MLAKTVALEPAEPASPPVRCLASLASALGLGAITAAAACCVLPLALASMGVGAGLAGGLAMLTGVRTPLLMAAAVVLAVAWVMWWRKPDAACASGGACATPALSRGSLALLIASTVLVGLAGAFPAFEPALMRWVS